MTWMLTLGSVEPGAFSRQLTVVAITRGITVFFFSFFFSFFPSFFKFLWWRDISQKWRSHVLFSSCPRVVVVLRYSREKHVDDGTWKLGDQRRERRRTACSLCLCQEQVNLPPSWNVTGRARYRQSLPLSTSPVPSHKKSFNRSPTFLFLAAIEVASRSRYFVRKLFTSPLRWKK